MPAMNFLNAIIVGFKEIWAYKFRSLLTMLGIVLGVASLVGMSALVKGMEVGAKEALVAIGGLSKFQVQGQELPPEQRYLRDQATGLTLKDVHALQAGAPLVTSISPEMRIPGGTLSANGKTFRPWVCSGVWPIALDLNEHVVEHGRMFNEIDDRLARNVCVIGIEVRNRLFGSPEEAGRDIIPIGETLYINGQPFTIIGMFQRYESEQDRKRRLETEAGNDPVQNAKTGPNRSRGYSGQRGNFVFFMKNATVYVPLSTVRFKFRTGNLADGGRDERLSSLEIKIRNYEDLTPTLQQVRNILMITHRGIEDFSFRTSEEWADRVADYVRNARVNGALISSISLLVGGIGIMNIMLASISGRIREIGLRKAVGAATSDIFIQILIESVVIAGLGGLLGALASYGLVHILGQFSPTGNTPIITTTALAVAFSASAGTGVLAGLLPAFKAARLDPIVALRYE
jgi:putative ABC transport system permease protein